jgi:hypothetical protein
LAPGRLTAAAAFLVVAALLAGCAGRAEEPTSTSPAATAAPDIAVISDRDGPSWNGRPGETVQIDWYDRTTGETVSEQVAVLGVRRFPNPDDDAGPDEFGDAYGPYEWRYGIRVRLTSLDGRAARYPTAYQFLQLSDGRDTEDGVSGLGEPGGPDPSLTGKSSAGWLYQYAEQGFAPTEVVLPVGAWRATWSLGSAAQDD